MLLKRLFLLDELLVLLGHEVARMHVLNLQHGTLQEGDLVVQSVGIVSKGANLTLVDQRHLGVGLQKLWLKLEALFDQFFNAETAIFAGRLGQVVLGDHVEDVVDCTGSIATSTCQVDIGDWLLGGDGSGLPIFTSVYLRVGSHLNFFTHLK